MKVSFPLLDSEIEIEDGALVSDACARAGAPLNLVCGGNGTCNKCRVDVVEGGQGKNVLGCQYPVSEGMEILVTAETSLHQLLETTSSERVVFKPRIHDITVNYSDLVTPMGSYDFGRLAQVLREQAGVTVKNPTFDMVRLLNTCYRGVGAKQLNVILSGLEIIDLVPADGRIPLYGLAVDIGTTSVVAFLYNLTNGRLIGHRSKLNSQIVFGADVINRIDHASKNILNRRAERDAIEDTINELIAELCGEFSVKPESIYEAAYCGNSTMQHLFLGINPEALGHSPFTGVISQEVELRGDQSGININPNGRHVFMPLLGGFVGADTTACLLELPADGKMRMMLDLGTNAEVTLGIDSRTLTASTACGPALEGAGLSQGMRATAGAIEAVSYEDGGFVIQVIGGADPVGYCGSGIIDIVAVLLELGVITPRGGFIKGSKLENHPLHDRIRTNEEGQRYFVLVPAEDNPAGVEIIITQMDVRAIQLAKAAIYTGCTLLFRIYGLEPSDIDEICLAGAFGNYINIKNGQSIGLLPKIEGVPVRSMGNGAGLGVQRYLLSTEERSRADGIRRHTTHVELAEDPSFREVYVQSMNFEVNLLDAGSVARAS